MQEKKFQRRIEDFVCGGCGQHVQGSGYTNHCPGCLWSKHVDINPGDRKSECGGLMKPIGAEVRSGHYTIHHLCLSCGHKRRIKASPADNFDALLALVSQPLER